MYMCTLVTGADLSLLIREFLRNKIFLRGLAHPFIFAGPSSTRRVVDRSEFVATDSATSTATRSATTTAAKAVSAASTGGKNEKRREIGGGGEGDEAFSLFTKFGAVEVNGANFLELLKRNETILLFPG